METQLKTDHKYCKGHFRNDVTKGAPSPGLEGRVDEFLDGGLGRVDHPRVETKLEGKNMARDLY
jgi:hypothetical protein